jgi:hypothetical protein
MLQTIIENIVDKFKIVSISRLLFSILMVTAIYIFWPTFFPAVIVQDDFIIYVKVDNESHRCQLFFSKDVFIMSTIYSYQDNNSKKNVVLGSSNINQKLRSVEINLNSPTNLSAESFHIEIKTKRFRTLAICKVLIDGKKIKLRDFYESNLNNNKKKYQKINYIREDIANFLFFNNDFIGNLIMTFMLFFIIPLTYIFCSKSSKLLFRKHFKNRIKRIDLINLKKDELRINYFEKYSKENAFFTFLTILGPAIGFLLTISSLIAGLHPSLFSSEDIGQFFSAIQLAMVSTFLGLFIRIEGLILIKINEKLLIIFEETISNEL